VTTGPAVEDVAWLTAEDPSAAGQARRAAEQLARRLGLPEQRVAEVGLAVTEIATNTYRHGGGGALLLRAVHRDPAAVEVVALDSGPGIRDLRLARRDGTTTAGSLGIGLGAIGRLADELTINTRPGRGTVLLARFEAVRGSAAQAPWRVAGITRALGGETVCGDAYSARLDVDGRLSLMVCDGSGHGALAASASRDAVRAFEGHQGLAEPPAAAVQRIHRALAGSRGGAVAVAVLDPDEGTVRYAGVGNIAGAVLDGAAKRSMVSVSGVAGYREPKVREFSYPLVPCAVVIMHSDGVRSRWDPDDLRPLLAGPPLVLAATVLRDAGARHDDACVLVGGVAG
jgi:anti-sigma regulatory factor (Ser/Thr protein kinase)